MFNKSFQISTADINDLTPPAKLEPTPRDTANSGSRGADIDSMKPISEAAATLRPIPREDLVAFVQAVLHSPDVREMHLANLRERAPSGCRELDDGVVRMYARTGLHALEVNQLRALAGNPENLRRFVQYSAQAEVSTAGAIVPAAAEPEGVRFPAAGARPVAYAPIPPPPPESQPGFELGDAFNSLIRRYGFEKKLPEAVTRTVFRNTPPDLLARVPMERLREFAWWAVVGVDANAHVNPDWNRGHMREQTIRIHAEGMLRREVERDQGTSGTPQNAPAHATREGTQGTTQSEPPGSRRSMFEKARTLLNSLGLGALIRPTTPEG